MLNSHMLLMSTIPGNGSKALNIGFLFLLLFCFWSGTNSSSLSSLISASG